jgi:small-conductance mechanosensitive channel
MGRTEAIEHVPAGKLRRSGFAVWSTVVGTATFGLAAQAVHLGFSWAGALTPRWEDLAVSLVVAISWGAFVAALGRAILANAHPGWRLLPVSDALAGCLKSYPVIIALVATCGYLLERVNAIAGTGLSTALVSNCIIALGYSLAGGCLLLAGQRSPCAEAAAEASDPEAPSTWRSIRAVVWIAIALPILGVLFGYIALAGFVARQTLWIGLVGMTLYLLLHFADDLFTTLFDTKCRFGRFCRNNFGLGQNRLEQLGILLSAGTRVTLLFLGIAAILAPFGTGPTVLVGDLGRFGAGITIGQVTISPTAVLTAVSVFALGIVVARLVRRWLNDKYLPKTSLDRGVQDSVSTVVGYAGIILAGLWALNALGLGVERLALVASALSVGIGFGLQAIVQNFISGLILLAERPVKVGDWVAIGDQEGDIRKISVRATEIQLGDRSTLVVPNSELITKTVRNVTMASPLGKVAIMIGVSHDADVGEVRAILLETLTAHPAMKADPAPGVFFDSIRDMGLFFNAFGFVASPRDAYPVKSEILFELLERFRKAGIEIARPRQDVRVISPMPEEGRAEARPGGRFLQ